MRMYMQILQTQALAPANGRHGAVVSDGEREFVSWPAASLASSPAGRTDTVHDHPSQQLPALAPRAASGSYIQRIQSYL